MANEISVRAALNVDNGNLQYQSTPSEYTANMLSKNATSPGVVTATPTGVWMFGMGTQGINFSALEQPSMSWIQNLDNTLSVTVGLYWPDNDCFLPVFDLLAGEFVPLRLSKFLGSIFPGTGTTNEGLVLLDIRGNGGTCKVRIDAFDGVGDY